MTTSKYRLWYDQLSSIDPKQQKEWIHETLRSKKHLDIFGRYFFPHIIKGLDDVPEAHLDLIETLTKPGHSAIIFPRGFAKSTWEKIDTIHDIIYALEPVILYIGRTIGEAQHHFESIRIELENNEGLRFVYGNFVPSEATLSRKWTNKHLETTNGVNLVARGRGKGRGVNIRNQRPTKVVADDIEDDEEVANPIQREKLHNWIYEVILPSLDPDRGRFKFVGTVIHPKAEVLDFYNKHKENSIFRKAIETDEHGNQYSIWPSHRPIVPWCENKRKEIGTRAWNKEYQNSPTADDMARLNPVWITDRMYTTLPRQESMEKIIHCDPQAGESGLADEYAITCLGWYPKDIHRYALEQQAGRASQWEQAKNIVRMWLRHDKRVKLVAVEKVLNQTAVYQYLLLWKARRVDFNTKDITLGHPDWIDESDRNIPLYGFQPRGKDGGKLKDKVARAEMHDAAFERGEIHLRPEMSELRDQLCFLGTSEIDHDDRADSLIGALDLSYKNVSADTDKTDKAVVSERKQEYTGTIAGNLFKKTF